MSRKILLCILVVAICAILVPIGMRMRVGAYIVSPESVPESDIILILGASVARGMPSPILADRADTAISLYERRKAPRILVTGDSEDITHDEVTPVRKYLASAGIPLGNIVVDEAGFDTYSSMYRAHSIFHEESVIIVTQDFHLPRALWIAHQLGLHAYGVVAGTGGTPFDYLREIPASLKAVSDVFLGRVPREAAGK